MKITDEVSLANLVELHKDHPNYAAALCIKYTKTPLWQRREHIRCLLGIYKPIKFSNTELQSCFNDAIAGTDTYPHISAGTPLLIAYTKDEASADRDIQTPSKLGKFLTAINKLSTYNVNRLANDFLQMANIANNKLVITQNPIEIFSIYTMMSTTSCMSHKRSKWKLKYEFILPTTDLALQKRIEEFKKDLGNTTSLHPTMFYGLSPDLALAYYRTGERIQARTIVHLTEQEYVRVYGNEFMHEMLRRAGYVQKSVFSPFTSAVCVCNSEMQNNSVVLAPYLDGSDPHNAYIDVENGALLCKEFNSPKTNDHLQHLGTLRNYDVGGQRLYGTYTKTEELYKDVCTECKKYQCIGDRNPIVFTKEHTQKGQLCIRCVEKVTNNNLDYHLGLCIKDKKLRLCLDYANNFQYVAPFITNKDMSLCSWEERKTRNTTYVYALITNIYKTSNVFDLDQLLRQHGWQTEKMLHISSLDELEYDADAHAVAPAYEFVAAVFPDRTVKQTLQETTPLFGSSGTYLLAKYGTTRIVNPLRNEYVGELKTIRMDNQYLVLETQCTEAFLGHDKILIVLPRSMLTYATATRNWYHIPNLSSFIEPLGDDINPIELMEEYGKEILEAKDIIYNYLPFYTVPYEKAALWEKEITVTRRFVTIEPPPPSPIVREEPTIGLTMDTN